MVGLGAHQEAHVKELLAEQQRSLKLLLAESADSILQQLTRRDAKIEHLENELRELKKRASDMSLCRANFYT